MKIEIKGVVKLGSLLGLLGSLTLTSLEPERAYAFDLTSPFLLETAQVLPVGVRNPRFINVFMSVDSKFNGSGQAEALGHPLHKQVHWGEVIHLQRSDIDKGAIRSTLRDANLSIDGSPGSTTGQVNSYFNVKVPALAVGITDRFTLAAVVPIMDVNVSADTGFIRSEDGQKWVNKLCALSVAECNKAANKLNNSVNEKLTTMGYEPIQSMHYSNIGDIQLVGKYLVNKDRNSLLSVKSTLVLPTGTQPNVDKALDIPTGDGRFQLGGTVVYDQFFAKDYRWNLFSGLMAHLPNQMERRIPTAYDDPLSFDKEKLTRNLRTHVLMGTSLSMNFPSTGFVAGAGYNFQFLSKSTYSGGTQFTPDRYAFLESLTPSETLHSTTLMAGFSTVEWFQQKKFVYPFQANVTFSHPLIGRNVTTNDVISGELVLFF